jgi:formylmethanofuran dehydrogenase subunit E
MKRTEHMSEEQEENVAEELTEWSEIDLSPEDKKEKVEFEVEGSEPEELVAEPEPQPEPEPVRT